MSSNRFPLGPVLFPSGGYPVSLSCFSDNNLLRRVLLTGQPHRHPVDLHAALGPDEHIPHPVDDAGLHQVAALGVHLDFHVWGAHLQLALVHQVLGGEPGVWAKGFLKALGKGLPVLLLHAAGGEHHIQGAFGEHQGLGVLVLLVLGHHVHQPSLHGLDHIQAAVAAQGVR